MLAAVVTTLSFLCLVLANFATYWERYRFVDAKRKAGDMSSIMKALTRTTELKNLRDASQHYMRIHEVNMTIEGDVIKVFKENTNPMSFKALSKMDDTYIVLGNLVYRIVERIDNEQNEDVVTAIKLRVRPSPHVWFGKFGRDPFEGLSDGPYKAGLVLTF